MSAVFIVKGSFGTFCVIDVTKKLPRHCRVVPERHVRRRKRSRSNSFTAESNELGHAGKPSDDDSDCKNCTICLRYNSMLYLDFCGPDEMVVVEQPWLHVVATFPEALQRRVYGCN